MLSKFGGIPIWEEVPIYLLKLFHTQLPIWTILQEPLVPVIKTNNYLSVTKLVKACFYRIWLKIPIIQ